MDSVAVQTVALGAMVAGLVALVKALLPGTVDSRVVLVLVGTVTAGVVVLASVSGMLDGLTPFAYVAEWLNLALAAMGIRAGTTTIVPAAGNLPSR